MSSFYHFIFLMFKNIVKSKEFYSEHLYIHHLDSTCNIFSLSLKSQLDYDEPYILLYVCCVWCCWASGICRLTVFTKFETFLAIIFQVFLSFLSFRNSNITYILLHKVVIKYNDHWSPVLFLSVSFWILSIVMSSGILTFSPAMSNLPLT